MAQIASLLVPGVNIPQPDNSWLGSIADSIGGAVQNVRADRSFNGLADRLQGGAAMPQQQPAGGFLSRLTGQTAQPQMPRATQSAGGRLDPSIRDGIVSTANSLGISPVDLATAISYETGGTFDPTKSGPTTQWGQHRGLIQFGEPQAQKYGVNWDDPVGSQLGENGAVANYLRDTGVKPGMGLMDIYSAINAGGVGRYDRSDANNGGAPGTVADKVNNQMRGHRARAMALFGGENAALEANLGTPYQPSLAPQDPNAEARRQEAMKQIIGGQPNAVDAVTAMGEGGSLASAFSGDGQAPRAPMQVADSSGGSNLIAQGVTPVQPGSVDPSIIQYMLRDRNLRDVGLKLWAANAGGQKASEPWQFVNLPDGTLARANQQTGAVERLGNFAKPNQDAVTVGDNLVDRTTGRVIYEGKPKTPASFQEFQLARENGFTGSYADWEKVKVPGAANVTVNAGEGDKFYENLDKKNAEMFSTLSDSGMNGRSRLAQLGQLEGLLQQSPSGAEAGLKLWLGDMGINSEGLDSLQATRALIEKMVPEQRQAGSGPMSDADIVMYRRSLPSVMNQPGGNELVLGTAKAIAEYDIKMGEIADAVADRSITPSEGRKRIRELENPLSGYTEKMRALRGTDTNGRTPPRAPAPPSAPQAPAGVDPNLWRYMTPEERKLWQN